MPTWTELSNDPKQMASYLDRLDAQFAQQGIGIHARSFHAWSFIQRDLKIMSPFGGPVSQVIDIYYATKYGDRCLIDFAIGRVLVLLGHDAWALRFPTVYGTGLLDFRQMLEQGTPALVASITAQEERMLEEQLPRFFEAFEALKQINPRLRADEGTAVDQAIDPRGDLGLSKWASQQMLEKILSAFITKRGGKVPRRPVLQHHHHLLPVVEAAESLGLTPTVDRAQLAKVECRAGVRYPRNQTTLREAVEANQASVLICGQITKVW